MTPPKPLEAFSYVARYGGLAGAQQRMHGISRQAISMLVTEFEEFVGRQLFVRPEMTLNEFGQEMLRVCPDYERIDAKVAQVRAARGVQLRIGVGESMLKEYFGPVMAELRRRWPEIQITAVARRHRELVRAVEQGTVDLAVTMTDLAPPTCKRECLMRLPIVLLAPKAIAPASIDALWARGRINEPLAVGGPIAADFQRALAERNVDWVPTTTVEILSMAKWYAQNAGSFAATVDLPAEPAGAAVEIFRLPEFGSASVGVIWTEPANPRHERVLEILRAEARRICPQYAVDGEAERRAAASARRPKSDGKKR